VRVYELGIYWMLSPADVPSYVLAGPMYDRKLTSQPCFCEQYEDHVNIGSQSSIFNGLNMYAAMELFYFQESTSSLFFEEYASCS
jgi:hypothetical protein